MARDLASATAEYRAAQQAIPAVRAAARAMERESQDRLRRAREQLAESIVAAHASGKRVMAMATETGLSRETIRTALRAAGVEPD